LADRVFAMATGGGQTFLTIDSEWRGNLRWARNLVSTSGDSQESQIGITRNIVGARGHVMSINSMDDARLRAAMHRAEETVLLSPQDPDLYPTPYPDVPADVHPHSQPVIWFDKTFALDAAARGAIATPLIEMASSANLVSAAYLAVSANGDAVLSTDKLFRYYPYTTAEYSVTVRDPAAAASGWAGVDFNDWTRIDATALTRTAIDKCQRMRNPVAVEPGRFTAILEPQALCDLFAPIMDQAMGRIPAEQGQGPFAYRPGQSKIGQRLLDPRLTVSADPMDPDCGFVPFDWNGEPYLKTNWFEDGILKELEYPRFYGLQQLNRDWALPNSRAFRISGGTATVEQMIADTLRGVLVTRFNDVHIIDFDSMLLGGNTRDGLWLIEHGKISKPIKNFRFTESPLFILNGVEELGVPQRVFRPGAPAVCPAVKVRDFNFAGLMDAV
jgi:predicted Zn-dependent protease